jgi:hypothetical protein
MAHISSQDDAAQHIWFLDSGCSNHICGRKDIFFDFDCNFKESVKMGNNSSLSVHGRGRIRIEVNGIYHVITDVFFVLELKNNLLSIGQLMEKGLAVTMQQGKCKIFHPVKGLIIEIAMTHNRLFTIIGHCKSTQDQAYFSTINTDQATLWHHRYGHLSWNGIKTLQQKKMVNGLPPFKATQQVCT